MEGLSACSNGSRTGHLIHLQTAVCALHAGPIPARHVSKVPGMQILDGASSMLMAGRTTSMCRKSQHNRQ